MGGGAEDSCFGGKYLKNFFKNGAAHLLWARRGKKDGRHYI